MLGGCKPQRVPGAIKTRRWGSGWKWQRRLRNAGHSLALRGFVLFVLTIGWVSAVLLYIHCHCIQPVNEQFDPFRGQQSSSTNLLT